VRLRDDRLRPHRVADGEEHAGRDSRHGCFPFRFRLWCCDSPTNSRNEQGYEPAGQGTEDGRHEIGCPCGVRVPAIADKPEDRNEALREKMPQRVARHATDAEVLPGDNEGAGLLQRYGGGKGGEVERQCDKRDETGCGPVGLVEYSLVTWCVRRVLRFQSAGPTVSRQILPLSG
jgi:hypothetical protein